MSTSKKQLAPSIAPVLPQASINLASPLSRRHFLILMLPLVLVFTGNIWFAMAGQIEAAFIAAYNPEGIVDSLGGLFVLFGAITFAAAYITRRWTPGEVVAGRPAASGYYLFASIACLLMVGEEFHWGAAFGSRIGAKPWSLMSLIQPLSADYPVALTYGSVALITWLCVMPVACGRITNLQRIVNQLRAPLPSRLLGRIALGTMLVWIGLVFEPGLLLFGPMELEEGFEASLEILLFAWSMEEYQWSRIAGNRPWSRFLTILLSLFLFIGASQIAVNFVMRGMPAVRSHRLYQQALQHSSDEDSETVIALFTQSIQEFPGNDGAHYGLARTLLSNGRLAEAIPHFETAVAIAPDQSEYQEGLAVAYINLLTGNSFRRAVPHLERAIELLSPKDPHRAELANLKEKVLAYKRAGEEAIRIPAVREKVEEYRRWRRNKVENVLPTP
ncbi:tetratricopeptide repeat protein [bacterium]|nr:tetratricopeptide repeat protein [bacterium]